MRNVGLVLVVVGVGLAALLADSLFGVRPAPPPAPEEPTHTRTTSAGPDATDPELARFFTALGQAAARRDGAAGAELFDPDRLSREAGATTDPHGPARVFGAVWDGFAAGWLGSGWTETRLRRIDRLPGGAEAVVFARHRTPGGVMPARWWLIRRDGRWRAYDLEDVRVGLRLSDQLAAMTTARANEPDSAALEAALKALAAASAALAGGDATMAAKAIAPARAARLPPPHRAVLCLTEAAIALGENDPAAALDQAGRADQVRPGIPGTDLIRAIAYHRLRKWPEAAAAARRYIELLGPDPQASLVLGVSLLELGRQDEAAGVLRAAAAEYPDDAGLSGALRRAADPIRPGGS